jgi:hypothetical protein
VLLLLKKKNKKNPSTEIGNVLKMLAGKSQERPFADPGIIVAWSHLLTRCRVQWLAVLETRFTKRPHICCSTEQPSAPEEEPCSIELDTRKSVSAEVGRGKKRIQNFGVESPRKWTNRKLRRCEWPVILR